ncbi:hypothetical protein AB0E00_10980 [Streptomyces sp. NPDC048110]|uniref:hypothetical protein n=1 Tax=Streptomyces sp. NPDC048110 TaxID=3155483 RepID=UPI0033C332E2
MTVVADEETTSAAGSRWKSLLENLNFVVAVIGLVVGLVAFFVPIRMDRQAQERERSRTCVDAVIDLRAALRTIENGYATGPDQKSERTVDWDAGKAEIERVQASCLDAPLASANGVEQSKALWQQYDTEQNAAQHGPPSLEAVRALDAWTLDAIADLTQR